MTNCDIDIFKDILTEAGILEEYEEERFNFLFVYCSEILVRKEDIWKYMEYSEKYKNACVADFCINFQSMNYSFPFGSTMRQTRSFWSKKCATVHDIFTDRYIRPALMKILLFAKRKGFYKEFICSCYDKLLHSYGYVPKKLDFIGKEKYVIEHLPNRLNSIDVRSYHNLIVSLFASQAYAELSYPLSKFFNFIRRAKSTLDKEIWTK